MHKKGTLKTANTQKMGQNLKEKTSQRKGKLHQRSGNLLKVMRRRRPRRKERKKAVEDLEEEEEGGGRQIRVGEKALLLSL